MILYYTILDTNAECSSESRVIRIGRAPDAEIRLDRDFISRRHAELREESGRFTIEDCRSDNGTFVNGQRIAAPTVLGDGDRVRFGDPGVDIRLDRMTVSAEPSASVLTPASATPSSNAPRPATKTDAMQDRR